MKSLLQNLVRTTLAAGLTLVATFSANAQDDVGIVRITKPHSSQAVAESSRGPQVTQASFGHHHGYGAYGGACPNCDCQYGGGTGCPGGCYRHPNTQALIDYLHCKFGYFIPTGAGGAGVPFCGKYSRVYPNDPYYFDNRDGQAWAAQGYGLPMAVPLAPVVGHAYNYSWGTPSSRLTPVSRPAY